MSPAQAAFLAQAASFRPAMTGGRDAALARLDAIARALDAAWRIPGLGVRIGLDPLLNLVPLLGPVASKGVSAYLLWEARRLGAPPRLIGRMIGNLCLDAAIGAVPLAGWVADGFWRANLRNLALLRAHLEGAGGAGAARR